MKIAMPSDDRTSIASHFGRAQGFLVFEISGNVAKEDGYRPANVEPKDECMCGAGERPSRHEAILEALTGCDVVIARGMGPHMYDDLLACGIDVFLTDTADASAAIEQFMSHSLPERATLGCALGSGL